MAKNAPIHRILAFLKHRLTAWNTTGEGIHSPYLFELVRFILRDPNSFYCFEDIERQRAQLLACTDQLEVIDYGSQGSPEGMHVTRRVCDIARNHLESKEMGQVLFRLVNWMGQQAHRPLEILELGTSLGITTAYLASPDSRNRVTTLEGSGALLRIAQNVWKNLHLENIAWIEGPIDHTLLEYAHARTGAHAKPTTSIPPLNSSSLSADHPLDIAYIDANHTYEPTMRYAALLLPLLSEKGVLIIDDIHYSESMEQAWRDLKNLPSVTTSMDLYHMGLLFVDPHYLRRHYRIRI